MIKSNKTISQYLSKAKVCTDKALQTVNNDNFDARKHLQKAIHYLQTVDSIIIHKHINTCILVMIKKDPIDQIISEIMKTYKYASS